MKDQMRLQQYIAKCGVASRRKAEELITMGSVTVNGRVITELGSKVMPGEDHVKVNGKLLHFEPMIYLVMNKPEGGVCSVTDDKARPTVIDLLKPAVKERVFPVGRLDYNTTGCLLITNDGDWANRVLHPKYKVPKVYTAKVKGRFDPKAGEQLKRGVTIEGKRMRADDITVARHNEENDIVKITISQGMNHQVKLMMQAVGYPVVRLKRESVGKITATGLEPGAARRLLPQEVALFNEPEKKGGKRK